jgi:hypothetical protein
VFIIIYLLLSTDFKEKALVIRAVHLRVLYSSKKSPTRLAWGVGLENGINFKKSPLFSGGDSYNLELVSFKKNPLVRVEMSQSGLTLMNALLITGQI